MQERILRETEAAPALNVMAERGRTRVRSCVRRVCLGGRRALVRASALNVTPGSTQPAVSPVVRHAIVELILQPVRIIAHHVLAERIRIQEQLRARRVVRGKVHAHYG